MTPTEAEMMGMMRLLTGAADAQDLARDAAHDAGLVQTGAQNHDRDDGDDRVGAKAIKQVFDIDQPRLAGRATVQSSEVRPSSTMMQIAATSTLTSSNTNK